MLLKEKRDSNHEWEEKVHRKNISREGQSIARFGHGMSVKACSAKYFVFVDTIINWKKNKSEIISSISKFTTLSQKRLARVSDNGKVIDERVYEWFANIRYWNIPVFGPILQTKPLQVATNIGLDDFRASNGWLEAFRKRQYIQFCLPFGKNAGMDENVVNHWKQNLPNIIQGYDTRDIWNVDKTRLLWKGVLNRNLVLQGEKCKVGKLAKERFTIALFYSATGEKFKPLVIGKS